MPLSESHVNRSGCVCVPACVYECVCARLCVSACCQCGGFKNGAPGLLHAKSGSAKLRTRQSSTPSAGAEPKRRGRQRDNSKKAQKKDRTRRQSKCDFHRQKKQEPDNRFLTCNYYKNRANLSYCKKYTHQLLLLWIRINTDSALTQISIMF